MPDDRYRSDEPPRRRPRDDDEEPRRRRREEFDDDEQPRRRRRDEDEGDATGGLIPYKNGKALASYYCGVFSLIPILGGILGPLAVILGFLGFSYANQRPRAGGKAHAIVGIVLGLIGGGYNLGGFILIVVAGVMSK